MSRLKEGRNDADAHYWLLDELAGTITGVEKHKKRSKSRGAQVDSESVDEEDNVGEIGTLFWNFSNAYYYSMYGMFNV